MPRKKYTKRKRKSNKTRRRYKRRKKRKKTKRIIKGGGKKFDELLAEIYLNRDLILGHHPKPLTDQEAHNLTVATEKSMYDSFPTNNDPNEDRIAKYMIARKFWRKKEKKKYKKSQNTKNNRNSMNFRPISFASGSDSDSDTTQFNSRPSSAMSGRSSAASLAAGLNK